VFDVVQVTTIPDIKMATEAVCMDAYCRAPTLHYVTSADDVMQYYSRQTSMQGRDRRAPWTSYRDHHDSMPRRQAATSNSSSGPVRGEVSYCRRKLSVDEEASSRPGAAVPCGGVRRRPPPGTTSDDAWRGVSVEDCSYNRRRSSAWSPVAGSTLSRTMSEHTLDRNARYRSTDCRDDILDEWTVDADGLESVLSPPRIAPVSGQLSLVCESMSVRDVVRPWA